MDQIQKQLLLHDIGIHENIAAFCIAVVRLNGENTLLLVQSQDIAVQVSFLCIIYRMIKQGDVCTGINMLLDQFGEISRINHIIWCDYHIWMMHFFDVLQIFIIGSNIGIIDCISLICIREKNLQLTALGVDIIMTSGTDMGNQCTGFFLYIDLDTVNAAVAQIGNREVDNTISAQEREGSDGR